MNNVAALPQDSVYVVAVCNLIFLINICITE